VPRFEQVLVDAGFVDGSDDVGVVGVAGQDDAHHLRVAFAHAAQQFYAGHVRHALVGHDDLDELAFQDGQRLVGAAGGKQCEVVFQRALQRFERADFIVHQQNGSLGAHGVSFRGMGVL